MNIKPDNFRWYAAFHNESHHPHVHMVAYSVEPNEAFLNADGISNIKGELTKHIFRQDLMCLCHCKSPWDKKEYAYNDISEAWESEGVVNNGANVCYFNYRIPSGEVKRFRFLPYQYEEIVFLLKKINGDDYFDNCEENYDE